VNSLQTSMNRLVTAGARNFLVFNLPPLGNTPRFNGSQTTLTQYNSRSQQFNTTLATMLNTIHSTNPAVSIYQFDTTNLFSRTLADPKAFGLTNVTSSAAPGLSPGDTSYNNGQIVSNPNEYMFWDDVHPTAAVHAILAQRALDLFRLPGDFNHDNGVDSADYVLWRAGGTPLHVADDYNVWRAHLGQFAAGGVNFPASGTVPEPNTVILFLFLLLWSRCGQRRGSLIRSFVNPS
jgi:phospholipase/lecithinase/hemolysin